MVNKKKNTIRVSKKDLKTLAQIGMTLLVLLIIGYAAYSLINFLGQSRINEVINERNLYCNTTWQDYINTEVVTQMTSYNATNCRCFYENQYTMDKLASICLCSCDLYELNGTFIMHDFRPLFSAIK